MNLLKLYKHFRFFLIKEGILNIPGTKKYPNGYNKEKLKLIIESLSK